MGRRNASSSYGVETAFEAIAAALVRYSSHRTRCSLSTSPHRGVYGGIVSALQPVAPDTTTIK
jgi:hypothetical protein